MSSDVKVTEDFVIGERMTACHNFEVLTLIFCYYTLVFYIVSKTLTFPHPSSNDYVLVNEIRGHYHIDG